MLGDRSESTPTYFVFLMTMPSLYLDAEPQTSVAGLMFFFQNLSFGMTKTIRKAATQRPAIQAYIIIRPHQPFPSVILLRVPIRFSAASMPTWFLSSPSTARLRDPLSASREAPNCTDCVLSAWAIFSRDDVSCSCSVRLCESNVSAWESDGSAGPRDSDDAPGGSGVLPLALPVSCAACCGFLDRIVEVKPSVAERRASFA
jgi:hypothetical protein